MILCNFIFALTSAVLLLLPFVTTSDHVCQHGVLESSFPPQQFFQVLEDDFINSYDEIMVIGDVHGCLDELKLLIEKANATGTNVLKILAGDFMKKGPHSLEVLRFLRDTPSVMAVRGNNDQKILDMQYKSQKFQYVLAGENSFIKDLTPEDLNFVKSLPYTMVIPSLDAVIVHAGIRPGLPMNLNEPFDLMNIRNVIKDKHCRGGWRPSVKKSKGFPWASQWDGPHHVVFAHDASRALQVYPMATGIDTRCVYGDYLTGYFIKGPRTGMLVHQKALTNHFMKSPSDIVFARWVLENNKKVSEESSEELWREFQIDYAH